MSAYDQVVSEVNGMMAETGYRRGAPSFEVQEIDGGVCNEGVCECCGQQNIAYHPFIQSPPRIFGTRLRYRAYAICRECGYASEF